MVLPGATVAARRGRASARISQPVLRDGLSNPIDEAFRTHRQFDLSGYSKVAEIPHDCLRKRLDILVAHDDAHLWLTKDALENVLNACSWVETGAGTVVDMTLVREQIQQHLEEFSAKGFRTLGVASKDMGAAALAKSTKPVIWAHWAGLSASGRTVGALHCDYSVT